jgi:hypothetical protein
MAKTILEFQHDNNHFSWQKRKEQLPKKKLLTQ